MQPANQKTPPSRWKRLLKWLGVLLVLGIVGGSIGGIIAYQWFEREILATLPETLGPDADFRFPCAVQIYDSDSRQVDEFYLERRVWVPIDELPAYVWQSFIAAEDRRFFEHEGVDPWGIVRALVVNLQGGSVRQGGSTITQQLVKNLLVGKERSYRRKLREAVLAYRLEKELNKMQLLELYINYVALGSGNYGVEAAARDYFGVSSRQLNPGQAALLAGLVPAPSKYSPRAQPELAASRRETVLKLMVQQGYLTADFASQYLLDPVVVPRQAGMGEGMGAAYLTEVRREVRRVFGNDFPFIEGLKVYTPYDPDVQRVAELAVAWGLGELEARQGARGPTRVIPTEKREEFLKRGDGLKLNPELTAFREPVAGECFVGLSGESSGEILAGPFKFSLGKEDLAAKIRTPDASGSKKPTTLEALLVPGAVLSVCLSENPEEATDRIVHRQVRPWSEGAAVVIENETGQVVALTGGYQTGLEGFIRATQARRQPGSSFKPFVYGAAIVAGRRQTDIVVDGPFSMIGTNGLPWSPQNYDGGYEGPVMLRRAIALSLNTVAVRLGVEVGIERVNRLAAGLGIRSPLRKDMTVVLGSSEVTPMDMAVAYASIARGGVRIDPVFVTHVVDRKDKTLAIAGDVLKIDGDERELPGAPGVRVMSAGDAYVLVDMMRNVFLSGTAKKGQREGMDFAGKTGTTSGFVDTWFVGYSPRYTVAVWIGTDGTASIGEKETGGKTALPVWSKIMEVLPNVPGERFPVPPEAVLLNEDGQWLGFARGNLPAGALPHFSDESDILPPFGLSEPIVAAPEPQPSIP